MMLVVTPTDARTERLRREYAKLHCFVYCATYKNLLHSAEKYTPDVVLLEVTETVSDALVQKVRRLREILPDVALITLADTDVSSLAPDLTYSLRLHKQTLQFQALYFAYPHKHASYKKGSIIIEGLLLIPTEFMVLLYGHPIDFSPEEVFLLRYLAEIYPRRADADELGRYCFTYGRKTPRSTVASRISRINKRAEDYIFTPIITHRRGEGYGFEF